MKVNFSLRVGLLDKQMIDCDQLPVGRVDDVEIDFGEGPEPRISAILTGSQALGDRIGGVIGRWMAASSRRFRRKPSDGPTTISPAYIIELEPLVELGASFDELEGVAPLERWLSDNFIRKLPGTGDASE